MPLDARGSPAMLAPRRALARLRAEPRPLRFAASRALWATGICRSLTMPGPGGTRMRFWPSSVSAALWTDPRFREGDVSFVTQALPAGGTLVDVGANVGQLTIAGAVQVGATGRVVAIEAHPRTFRFLAANVAMNGLRNVTLHHAAVGGGEGEVVLSNLRSDDQNFIGSAGRGPRVRTTTLDALLGGMDVDLLKVDVEGFEPEVLRGAQATLRRTRCVRIEYAPDNLARYGRRGEDVLGPLRAAGFELLRERGGALQPFEPTERESCDLVAARPGARPGLARPSAGVVA